MEALTIPYAGKNLFSLFNHLRQNPQYTRSYGFNFSKQYISKMEDVYDQGVFELFNTTPKIIHGDLKEENILCKSNDDYTLIIDDIKVIDWGLSFRYDKNKLKDAITQVSRRPYQFNLPFSVLLFDFDFLKEYTQILSIISKTPLKKNTIIVEFCEQRYNDEKLENGNGRRIDLLKDFNESIMSVLQRIIPENINHSLTTYIRLNLSKILIKYTKARRNTLRLSRNTTYYFDINSFAREWYLPVVDTYGYLLTYCNLLSYLLLANKLAVSSSNDVISFCIFIANGIKSMCIDFDDTIDGFMYRRKAKKFISQITQISNKIL
jgi:serine/threonine protein kinase